MVLLDTCCIIELCKAKPGLSASTYKKISTQAVILSVSFAEVACKLKIGKLCMNLSAQELLEQYESIPSVTIRSVSSQTWLDSIALRWQNKDPADRLIVGYAKRHRLSIVSSDKKIARYYKQVIW